MNVFTCDDKLRWSIFISVGAAVVATVFACLTFYWTATDTGLAAQLAVGRLRVDTRAEIGNIRDLLGGLSTDIGKLKADVDAKPAAPVVHRVDAAAILQMVEEATRWLLRGVPVREKPFTVPSSIPAAGPVYWDGNKYDIIHLVDLRDDGILITGEAPGLVRGLPVVRMSLRDRIGEPVH